MNINIRELIRIKCLKNRVLKHANSLEIYKTLDDEVLPLRRKHLPEKIYKYYSLCGDPDSDQKKIEAVKNNTIWGSTYSQFNDPYEAQFTYLSKDDFDDMGFPEGTEALWQSVITSIRNHITTICFTQNPDNMSMWSNYANNHQGFCIEYKIEDPSRFYPVIYVDERLKARELCIDLLYGLLNSELEGDERTRTLKHFLLLTAFKSKDWESEHEIRAIFINNINEVGDTGRLHSCKDIGVKPLTIFSGIKCLPDNERELRCIADDLSMNYIKCEETDNERFSVINGK